MIPCPGRMLLNVDMFFLICGISLFKVSNVYCEESSNIEQKVKEFVGTFSDYIGNEMWAWVGVVAGAAFVLCLILWIIASAICCMCGGKNK